MNSAANGIGFLGHGLRWFSIGETVFRESFAGLANELDLILGGIGLRGKIQLVVAELDL